MGMVAILVMWPGPVEQTFNPPSHGGSIWNLTLTGQAVSEEKMFKEYGRQTDGWQTTYRWPRPTYPISSPLSLWLRWAKIPSATRIMRFHGFFHSYLNETKKLILIINFSCSIFVLNLNLFEVVLCYCSDFILLQFSRGILQLQLSIIRFTLEFCRLDCGTKLTNRNSDKKSVFPFWWTRFQFGSCYKRVEKCKPAFAS